MGTLGSPGRRKYACMECGGRSSTVRTAATSACPITWPPNTRCQPTCGERPRNRFTSSGSRSRILSRSWTAEDMERHRKEVKRRPQPAMLRRDFQGILMDKRGPAHQRTDVVIGGAGFAGLAQAIALRQGLGDPFTVTVIDPALAHAQSRDPRASAIAAAARRLFEAIEVWDAVAADAQPILDMVVTDSKLDDAVRPTFLTFGGEVEEGEPFAHMVENRHLVDVLVAKAKEFGVDLRAGAVTGFEKADNAIEVALSDKNAISTRLLVGADGAHSLIREQAGIATHGWNYDQSAIVTTIGHEREHNGRAEEHFLPAGPFAILPLTGRRVSIVWTETTREAERIVALPDSDFHTELEKRFGMHLGEIEVIGPRRAFSL